MLGEKGFNELDMALFKHLLHNKKQCCFVRTQCDTQINGILDDAESFDREISAQTAFKQLQDEFRSYMNEKVIARTNLRNHLDQFEFKDSLI